MADDLTRYVAPEIEPALRAKADAWGLPFQAYLEGLVNGEGEWGHGEVDDDAVIDRFITDHAYATGDYMTQAEFSAWLREECKQPA